MNLLLWKKSEIVIITFSILVYSVENEKKNDVNSECSKKMSEIRDVNSIMSL